MPCGSVSRLASLFLWFVLVVSAAGQGLLEPPFGLRWGDSPEKLITWASKHSLDVNISLPGDQPALRVVRVSPRTGFLPDTRAAAVEAHFLGGGLFEVAVHYADPDASADLMAARFEELREQLTREQGKLLANQQQRSVEDQFVTRTRAFHREPVKGLFLLLAISEVEDLLRMSKESKFSLIYRNENYREELKSKFADPAARE